MWPVSNFHPFGCSWKTWRVESVPELISGR